MDLPESRYKQTQQSAKGDHCYAASVGKIA